MGIFSKKIKDEDKVVATKNSSVTPVAKTPAVKAKPDAAGRILLRPMISEKSTIGVSANKYTLLVDIGANKVEIKKAIEAIYGVKPLSVNIINERRKSVRFGRWQGQTRRQKKAIVTLKKGDSIKLYEGI